MPAAMISGTRDDTPEEEEEEEEKNVSDSQSRQRQSQHHVSCAEVSRRARGKWPGSIQGLLRHATAAALWPTRHTSSVTHQPRRQVQTLVTLRVASCRPTSPSLFSESAPKTFLSLSPPPNPPEAELEGFMVARCKGRLSD